MENNDKLYKQFEKAARRAEEQPYGRMDAVWNRVQDKLDHKRQRQIANYWKYTGMAALFLLFITIGFVVVQNAEKDEKAPAAEQNGMVGIDSAKVKETLAPKTHPEAETGVALEETAPAENATGTYYNAPAAQAGDVTPAAEPAFEADDRMRAETVSEKAAIADAPSQFDRKAKVTSARDTLITATPGRIEAPALVNGYTNNTVSPGNFNSAMSNSADTFKGIYSQNGDKNYSAANKEVIRKKEDITAVYAGVVTSATDGLPIPGASVTIKGMSTATVTDVNGKFTIEAQKSRILVVSTIGYVSSEVQLGDDLNLEITLHEDNQTLEAVVVSSYKTASRSTVNNSRGLELKKISQTKREDGQEPRAYRDGDNNTYDTDAEGVTDSPEGEEEKILTSPRYFGGSAPDSEPLYIIDGVAVQSGIIDEMEPSYVKSYKVLDDIDAINTYGGKAVNGAIVIKTKKLEGTKKKEFLKLIEEYRISDKDLNTTPNGQKIPVDNDESYEMFEENRFENPATTPLSTFSIDVDNASYTNIRRFLNTGQTVPKDAVRVEEMINFFKYNYPQPKGNDPFSINTEYSDCPWNPQHKLLKIGLKGKEMKKRELPASNFVFLIDVSGSMADENKLPLLKKNLRVLVNKMRGKDRIAIVVYAGAAEELLPSTSGYDRETILATIDKLVADGTTAGGDGIKLAYETAEDNFIEGGNNRVILATDGDFNVGPSSDRDMQDLIEEKRKSGVFLTCLGYGMGNYKDSKLETLADKGNGNYAYIDTEDEGRRYLGTGFNSSMYTIAKDVKIQIEFNPMLVQSYRLIGYENRRLNNEDFENDAIDAGELGSGHTVTALYEVIPAGVSSPYFTPEPYLKYTHANTVYNNYNNELATIKFRYKKPDGAVSMEMTHVVPNKAVALGKAPADFKFAAAVAWFGLKLRDSKLVPDKVSQNIIKLAQEGLKDDDEGYKAEFIKLVNMVE